MTLEGYDHQPRTEQDLASRKLTAHTLAGHDQAEPMGDTAVQDWVPTLIGSLVAAPPTKQITQNRTSTHTGNDGSVVWDTVPIPDTNISRDIMGCGSIFSQSPRPVSYSNRLELDQDSEGSAVSRSHS